MNIIALTNAGLAGFLVSLMMLECLRPVFGTAWPVQPQGLQFERRLAPWLLALLAGPALLWDQLRVCRLRKALSPADCGLVAVLIAVWSASYGVSLAWAVRALF